MGAFDIDKFRAKLERAGLKKVKKSLARRLYGDGKRQYAKRWVAEKEQEQEQEIADQRYEQDRKTPWAQTPLGMLILMIVAGLVVAVVVYWRGLN